MTANKIVWYLRFIRKQGQVSSKETHKQLLQTGTGFPPNMDFLQTCLEELLQTGTGVKHTLTLIALAKGHALLLFHLLHGASSLSTSGHLWFSSATSNRQGHLLSQSNPDGTQPSRAPLILLHLCFSHVHRCFLSNLRPARASSLSASSHVLMGRKYSL